MKILSTRIPPTWTNVYISLTTHPYWLHVLCMAWSAYTSLKVSVGQIEWTFKWHLPRVNQYLLHDSFISKYGLNGLSVCLKTMYLQLKRFWVILDKCHWKFIPFAHLTLPLICAWTHLSCENPNVEFLNCLCWKIKRFEN